VKALKAGTLELLFIFIFGVFHFALPFVLTPNPNAKISLFVMLQVSDFVFPGCFILAIASIIFCVTHNRYSAVLLSFLYSGGIVFHTLYFLGVVESVVIVPTNIILAVGIPVDALAVVATYDYYRRVHLIPILLPN
jgi:hypothetical protein